MLAADLLTRAAREAAQERVGIEGRVAETVDVRGVLAEARDALLEMIADVDVVRARRRTGERRQSHAVPTVTGVGEEPAVARVARRVEHRPADVAVVGHVVRATAP